MDDFDLPDHTNTDQQQLLWRSTACLSLLAAHCKTLLCHKPVAGEGLWVCGETGGVPAVVSGELSVQVIRGAGERTCSDQSTSGKLHNHIALAYA